MKDAKRRNLIIDGPLWKKIVDHARSEDRPISSLVRLALKEYLEKRGK